MKTGLAIVVGITVVASIFLLFGYSLISSADHNIVHESFAASYPLDVKRVYQKMEITDSDLYGFSQVAIYDNWIDGEISCEFCTRMEYTPGAKDKAQVAYASDKPHDFKDAKKLSFYIMGLDGNEIVKFKAAGKKTVDNNGKLPKEATYDVISKPVALTKNWQKIELDLGNTDLTGVTNAFAIEMQKGNNNDPVIFYVKAIRYDIEQPDNPVQTEN